MNDTITLPRKTVEAARFIVMAYAASNPKWDYAGKTQDPSGAHACYEELKAALAAPPQPEKESGATLPTKEMVDAAEKIDWSKSDVRGNIVDMWTAMDARVPRWAAPQPDYDTRQFSNLANQAHGFAQPVQLLPERAK